MREVACRLCGCYCSWQLEGHGTVQTLIFFLAKEDFVEGTMKFLSCEDVRPVHLQKL